MFVFSKPAEASIRSFLAAQKGRQFSYADVGASREFAPPGYSVDHNRIQLGRGTGVFELAKKAVRQWKMFDMPWVELCWPETPIEPDRTVAVVASHLGFWSLNACRIVYAVEENGALERYGFAYGTLPDHAARGEERFTVEYHPDDESVWYDLYAFSSPRFLSRIAYPFARALQKRFARDSKIAMRNAVDRA